jgi:hypothetical protein
MPYVLAYYICCSSMPSYPAFYVQGGRVTRKVRVGYRNDPELDSISICLIYNIYLLLRLGSHALTSRFVHQVGRVIMAPLSYYLSPFSQEPMILNLINSLRVLDK